LQAS
jgi:hypothetical protein